MLGLRRLGSHGLLIGLLGCSVAPPSAGTSSDDGTFTDDSGTTGGIEADLVDEACSPQNNAEFELTADWFFTGEPAVVDSTCTVTAVEQDAQDPRMWSFAFECLQGPAEVALVLEPPLEDPPFQVGDELAGRVGYADGGVAAHTIAEFHDSSGRMLVSLQNFHNGSDVPLDVDLYPFTFDWSPDPDCTTLDESCGVVTQLRLDASAGGEPLTLDPWQRYGILVEPPDLRYGLWVGDSWIEGSGDGDGDCPHSLPQWVVRYALVALP